MMVRSAGFACMVAGAALLLHSGAERARSAAWQVAGAGLFQTTVGAPPCPARDLPPAASRSARRRGDPVARLRAPRLGIDTVIAEGTDPKTLARGPGHMEGSGMPGEADNCIFAGHRDAVFARLVDARPGDLLEVVSDDGSFDYRVVSVEVVDQKDTRPLHPESRSWLTLVTCYPLDSVGPAPWRLVVKAEGSGARPAVRPGSQAPAAGAF